MHIYLYIYIHMHMCYIYVDVYYTLICTISCMISIFTAVHARQDHGVPNVRLQQGRYCSLCSCRQFAQGTEHTVTHCNTLTHCIHTATHSNTLWHNATHSNTLQHTAVHYNTLQHTLQCVLAANSLKVHIWMSHVTRMNESRHTYEWVMS